MTIFLVLGLLLALLLTGMPIFAALGLASLVVLAVFEGSVYSMADTVFASLNNPLLATIRSDAQRCCQAPPGTGFASTTRNVWSAPVAR